VFVRPVRVEFCFGELGVATRADGDADELGWRHDDRVGDCAGECEMREDIRPEGLEYERSIFVSHDIMVSFEKSWTDLVFGTSPGLLWYGGVSSKSMI
jgi:hypothetical protein